MPFLVRLFKFLLFLFFSVHFLEKREEGVKRVKYIFVIFVTYFIYTKHVLGFSTLVSKFVYSFFVSFTHFLWARLFRFRFGRLLQSRIHTRKNHFFQIFVCVAYFQLPEEMRAFYSVIHVVRCKWTAKKKKWISKTRKFISWTTGFPCGLFFQI